MFSPVYITERSLLGNVILKRRLSDFKWASAYCGITPSTYATP